MLAITKYHLDNLPLDQKDSVLLIPFRYHLFQSEHWTPYELDVLKKFPQAMEQFLSVKIGLYSGHLNISREADGWKAVCVAPVTCPVIPRPDIPSPHFYDPACDSAMRGFNVFLREGFDHVPQAYISISDDYLSMLSTLRSAKLHFENAQGVYAGLFLRPHYPGVKHAFQHPIAVSAVLSSEKYREPQVGFGSLQSS